MQENYDDSEILLKLRPPCTKQNETHVFNEVYFHN